MVKHTQTIRRLLPTNCLRMFGHFVRLALKGLGKKHLRANHATFVTKEFRKAVMKRARLKHLLKKTELKPLKQLTIINETFVLVFLGNRKGLILKALM